MKCYNYNLIPNQRIYTLSLDVDASVMEMLQQIAKSLVKVDCCGHSPLEHFRVLFVAVTVEVGQHVNPLISDQIVQFLTLPVIVFSDCL